MKNSEIRIIEDIREMEQKSEHFHSRDKGCRVVNRNIPFMHGNKISNIRGGYCKTHHVETCRCGWEFGWHYGTYSPSLEK